MTLKELFSMFSVYARFIIELCETRTYPFGERVHDGTTIDREKLQEYKDYIVEAIIPFETDKTGDAYLHIIIYPGGMN